MLSQAWGDDEGVWPEPEFDTLEFLKLTKIDAAKFENLMKGISADRETLRTETRQRTLDGLPHAPTALLYRPFVKIGTNRFVVASPWALAHVLRFTPWAKLMFAAKTLSTNRSPHSWFRAFGGQLESWCRRVAAEAQKSPYCRGTVHMPKVPGGEDEVEDVVLREGRAVVLFSVKSRVMDAVAAREAFSVEKTMGWYRGYFFEKKGDDYRGGAIRQLDARIRMIQSGKFAAQGIESQARILPVIVTYDNLGETDALHKWIERSCQEEELLQEPLVGPVTLARIDEFEDLMARIADGKSVVELLRRRQNVDRYRRLEQLVHERELPRNRRRLPFFKSEWNALTARLQKRLFGDEGA